MANKIVFVCGSPGAGKSSIISEISQGKNYKVANVGTLMFGIARKKGYVRNRDDIRLLDKRRLNLLQIETFKMISGMDGNIILDTHATVEHGGRYIPGITIEHARHLKGLCGFVYIDALTSDIAKRRKGDRTRRRENERLELIDVQRLVNISILSTCSVCLNLPLFVVFNEHGALKGSVKALSGHLRDMIGA
ncbi:MAG: AAA family ATPase [Candidatus Micrarchaeaceae archaeon]